MQFRITINCDGAAFEENSAMEVARILRNIAQSVEWNGFPDYAAPVVDTNGNTVGSMIAD
jgi:hypothetical protein